MSESSCAQFGNVEIEPNTVTALRTTENDGYTAVQLGTGSVKKLTKPRAGQLKGLPPVKHTREFRLDDVFHYSLNQPKDDTIVGSTEAWRHAENQVTQLGIGGDFHWDRVQGRLMTQFGQLSTTTPRNDASPGRGQWQLDNMYRYISEAYGGYHFGDPHRGVDDPRQAQARLRPLVRPLAHPPGRRHRGRDHGLHRLGTRHVGSLRSLS